MKRLAALYIIISVSVAVACAQEQPSPETRAIKLLAYSSHVTAERGFPYSVGVGLEKNKHLIYTAPVIYTPYESRAKQRMFGWNLSYHFTPNPENKTFSLFFPLLMQYRYRYYEYNTAENTTLYFYVPALTTKVSDHLLSLMTGYGFTAKFKSVGFNMSLLIGAQWDGGTWNLYYTKSGEPYNGYRNSMRGFPEPCIGGAIGVYYCIQQ